MARFQHWRLMRRFALYFPLSDRSSSRTELLRATEDEICRKAGGLTSYSAIGLYKTPSGAIQRDEIQVLEIFVAETAAEVIEGYLRAIAESIATTLGESSVAFLVDGQMNFVKPG